MTSRARPAIGPVGSCRAPATRPGTLPPDNTGYFFATGTSIAAPYVAGVAALIIAKHGGNLKPEQVRAALEQSADDLGKPGNDEFYGQGFVNALHAVQ